MPAVDDAVTRRRSEEEELEEIPTVHADRGGAEQESAVAATEEAEDELEAEAVQERSPKCSTT